MAHDLILPIELNNFAAGLTVIEFILGSVAIACVPLLFLGIWIIKVRRAQSLTLSINKKWYQLHGLELLVTFFGVLLAAFVAIVETKSEETVDITNNTVNATYCVLMNGSYVPSSAGEDIPYRFELDDTTFRLQKKMFCPYGIQALDCGSPKRNRTIQVHILQPKCYPSDDGSSKRYALNASSMVVGATMYINNNQRLESDYFRGSNISLIVPYVVRDYSYFGEIKETSPGVLQLSSNIISECKEKNISSLHYRPFYFLTHRMDDIQLFKSVLWHVCQKHDTSRPQVITRDPIQKIRGGDCYNQDEGISAVHINGTCIYNEVQRNYPEYLLSVDLKDVATLTYRSNIDGYPRNLACVNATLRYKYILIPKQAVGAVERDYGDIVYDNTNIVLPLHMEVIDDEYVHCESTEPGIGLQALIFSARDEWRVQSNISTDNNNAISKLTRAERYQAYAISLARGTFHYDSIIRINDPLQEIGDKCILNEIGVATVVTKDWSFIMLLFLASACGLIVIIALIFKVFLPTKYWDIGEYANNLRLLKLKPETLKMFREKKIGEAV